jgi:hypothetical protein
MSAPRISAEEFKKRYLASLRTQIAIDSKNLQANQLFKETAQPSQIEDNRSITEKSADIARLSQLLIKELSKITDMGSANDIVVNLDDEDKRFLLEQFGAISSEASRRFKFGFTKGIFMPFFEKFKESYLTTGGFQATPAEIAEQVIATESAQKAQETEGATGEYTTQYGESELPLLANMSNVPKGDWATVRRAMVREIRRQLVEEPLQEGQVRDRKRVLRWLDGSSDPETKGKTYGSFISYFAKYPEKLAMLNEILGGIAGAGISGKGIKGRGLIKSKSSPTIVATQGIPPMERFAKFGRYVIDKQKLKDGQCVVRFDSGACIHKIPARRIGKEVQNVLTKIAGGGLPSYDDINALNQDDRRYLYNIQKLAKMDAQIPSPDKDAETKDMEDFEKMRGQILAGNDNKDLLKKFKLTLLKFAKDGRIPRREVNEILIEMASLGM